MLLCNRYVQRYSWNQSVLKFTFHVKKTISDSDINVVLKEGQEKTVALTKIDETVNLQRESNADTGRNDQRSTDLTTSDESVAAVKDYVIVAKSEERKQLLQQIPEERKLYRVYDAVKPVMMTAEKTSFDVDLKDDMDHTYDPLNHVDTCEQFWVLTGTLTYNIVN